MDIISSKPSVIKRFCWNKIITEGLFWVYLKKIISFWSRLPLWQSKAKAKGNSDVSNLGYCFLFWYENCVLVMQFIWYPVIVFHMWQFLCDITLLSVLIIAHNYDNNEYRNWFICYVTFMTREDLNGTTMCVCVRACVKRLVLCLYMANVLMYMFNPER